MPNPLAPAPARPPAASARRLSGSRRLAHAWAALIQPPSYLPEDRRRRTRLLNALIWGLVGLFAVVLVGMHAFGLGAGPMVMRGTQVLLGLTPALLLAYWLNRTDRHLAAAALAILVTSIAGWLLVWVVGAEAQIHPDLFFYPVVSIILAALLLPGPPTVLTGLVNLGALLALSRQLPSGTDPLSLVVWYVFITALLGIASTLHRRDLARLERQTQALAEDVLARRQAEAALLESEQRFHNAFEFASSGVALVGLDGEWLQVNPALCALTGYSADELRATTAHAITHPADREIDQHHQDQLISGAWQSYQLEKRYVSKTGATVWVLVNASAVRDPAGQALYFVAQIHDITERQQVQAALEESRQRLTNAFDQAAIGMAWVALDGRFLRVNQTLCALLGYSAAELEAMTVADLSLPEDAALGQANRDQAQTGALNIDSTERRFRRKDGQLIWALVSGNLMRDALGAPLHFFSQIQDVTKRQAAEAALRESGERYRAMLAEAEHLRQFNTSIAEVMSEGLVLEDAAGNITLINPRLQEMLGYAPAELIGRSSLELIAPSERPAVARHAQERPAGITSRYETRLLTRTGREIAALISGTPLSKDGVFTGTLATIIDISERMAAEAALVEANAKLRGWLTTAEQRSRESALLNELNDLLQTCLTPDEAHQVIGPLLGPLFPGDAGRLYVIPAAGQAAAAVACWGPPHITLPAQFEQTDCWSLRRSRAHAVTLGGAGARPSSALVCGHVGAPWPAAYVCVPLVAQGETLGVLHLSRLPAETAAQPTDADWLESRQQLGRTVADSLALALANLRLRDRLREQSIRDPLTGLFNRRYLEETLERELHRARREARPVGVIMLDIDHFKSFNDTWGHEAGDHVLREVGHLLLAHTRGEDIACRVGGEELLLVLPGAGPAATLERAERLRAAVAAVEPSHRGQALRRVTISAGVAVYPAHGAAGAVLLHAADEALYAAKHAGRNCVRVAGSSEVAAA